MLATSKGFALSLDSLTALALIITFVPIMLMLVSSQSQNLHGTQMASDTMSFMESTQFSSMESVLYPQASNVIGQSITDSSSSIAEAIADLYSNGYYAQAENVSQEILAAIPSDWSAELLIENASATGCNGDMNGYYCVYQRGFTTDRNTVTVARHFVYLNDSAREMRLVIYK